MQMVELELLKVSLEVLEASWVQEGSLVQAWVEKDDRDRPNRATE
jgi:hypothetical protein